MFSQNKNFVLSRQQKGSFHWKIVRWVVNILRLLVSVSLDDGRKELRLTWWKSYRLRYDDNERNNEHDISQLQHEIVSDVVAGQTS